MEYAQKEQEQKEEKKATKIKIEDATAPFVVEGEVPPPLNVAEKSENAEEDDGTVSDEAFPERRQCLRVIKMLTKHKDGWPFSKPVDPALLNIPDYFTIIRNPMDLGTIRKELVSGKIVDITEFSAKVRLTFKNAKTYNPPTNRIHQMAALLENIFERKLKSVDRSMNQDIKKQNEIADNKKKKFENSR